MKAPQIGATELMISWLLYIIDIAPAACYYMISDEDESQTVSKLRLAGPLYAHPWIQQKLDNYLAGTRRSTVTLKQFPGGSIRFVSARSQGPYRQAAVKYILIDEAEITPRDINGQGSPIELLKNRQQTFFDSKLFAASTPKYHEEQEGGEKSAILGLYEKGTMETWHVPCPFCHKKQALIFDQLRHKMEKGKVICYGYECEHCKKLIHPSLKYEMIEKGEWIAGNKHADKFHHSYHINRLYSPEQWESWQKNAEAYYRSLRSKEAERSFINNVLARPALPESSEIRPEGLADIVEDYHADYVKPDDGGKCLPEGIAIITAGVDVQKDRVEVSFCGWGAGLELWHLGHYFLTSQGSGTDSISSVAWASLRALLLKNWRLSNGVVVAPEITLIDSRYNNLAVLEFCRRFALAYPSMGVTRGTISYKESPTKSGRRKGKYYQLNVSWLKTRLYDLLTQRTDYSTGARQVVHLPRDKVSDQFLRQLTAEYKKTIKGKPTWVLRYKRNEVLDCTIYAMAGAISTGFEALSHDDVDEFLQRLKESS